MASSSSKHPIKFSRNNSPSLPLISDKNTELLITSNPPNIGLTVILQFFFFSFSDLCGKDDAMMSMQQYQVACMDKLQYDIGICVRVRSKSTKCKECLPVFLDFEACFRVADMALLITEKKKQKNEYIFFLFSFFNIYVMRYLSQLPCSSEEKSLKKSNWQATKTSQY